MPGPQDRGRFVWYDLMTPDPAAAEAFYKAVAGWSTTPWTGEGGQEGGDPYMMFTSGDNPIGGSMKLPAEAEAQGAPPHWLAYVTVPDTAAAARRTQELGGAVLVPPTPIPGVGSFAVLRDPQGATFAPFTPTSIMEGAPEPPEPGRFSWHELLTSDHEAAFTFDREIFGWEKTDAMDMGEYGIYQMFGPGVEGSLPYGGMFNKPPDIPAPPHWLYYILVPDMQAALERVKDLGGRILNGPEEVPGGDLVAQCLDPQGAAFALHERKGDTAG